MEPDPQRERNDPAPTADRPGWSSYDELAAAEEATWRRDRRRRYLFGCGAFLLVLCVIGSVAGYVWYDRATRIDRSTPAIVVEQYIYAIFDQRSFSLAEGFECRDGASRQQIQDLMNQIEERERNSIS